MKRLFLFFAIFCVYLSLHANPLKLVTLISAPAEYIENGKPKGINVEIVTEAFTRMGQEITIEFFPWQRALKMVKDGQADGIIDVAYSKERAEYIIYPKEAMYISKWHFFKKKGTEITIDTDFENAKYLSVGYTRGFHYGGKVQEVIDNRGFKFLDNVHNNELNIRKVLAGRFDMFIGNKATILALAKRMGHENKIGIVKKTGTHEDFLLNASKEYMGFSKKHIKPQFVKRFSDVIRTMKKEGVIEKIENKYYQ